VLFYLTASYPVNVVISVRSERREPNHARGFVIVDKCSAPDRRLDFGNTKNIRLFLSDFFSILKREMRRELLTSEVTGLPNRRAFDEVPPSVAISDVDGLKAVNDIYGYEAGDALLKAKSQGLFSVCCVFSRFHRLGFRNGPRHSSCPLSYSGSSRESGTRW
jgi:hypothetical protein